MRSIRFATGARRRFAVRHLAGPMAALALAWASLPACRAQTTVTNVISGTISVPGERDVFTFNLDAEARFYFDSLTNIADLQWSLSGPSGTLVANRSFSSSDSQSIGDPTVLLPAGNYTLTIEDPGGNTNGYAGRLVNLAEATLLVPGTVVTNNLSPANKSDFYQFTASAGDQFYFQRVARVGLQNAWWRLLDPYDNQVFNQGFTDVGTPASPIALPATGIYTLLLEGYIGDPGSGSYAFNVVPEGHVTPPAFTGTSVQLGDLMTGNLVANTTNAYVFTLANAARVVFDTRTNSPGLTWTLRGPSGVVVSPRPVNASDASYNLGPFRLPAGDYQLQVWGNANNPYAFLLLDLATATPLAPGTPVTNALSPAGATAAYRFTLGSAARYYFDYLASSGLPNAWWRLVDPYDHTLFSTWIANNQGPLALANPGTYTLLVEGYFNDAGTGTNVFNVVPVSDGLQALALGATVTTTIAAPGQRQQYTVTLASPTRLYLDALTNTSQFRWSLDGPAGNLVPNSSLNGDNNLGLSPAGNYTLTVWANGDTIGTSQFRLLDLATASALTLGTPVSDTLNPANSTKAYQFTLAAAGKYFFDYQSSSGVPNAGWRLLDPRGVVVYTTSLSYNQGPLTLLAGTYTLLVEGWIAEPGSGTYTFNVVPVTDGTQSLTLGTTVSGAVTTPGQRQQYTFTLPAATRLYYDALTNVSGLRWYLDGPTGNVVNNAGLYGDNLLGVLSAGTYTLTVFANNNNDALGTYQFRLIDLGTATALTPGTPVNDTLNPANSTKAFQFSLATAGRYFFDYQNSSGVPNASWRLLDARGTQIFSTGLGSDQGPLNLAAGAYTLLAEGWINEPGSGSYTFNVLTVADGVQALALGGVVAGAVATPGQQQQYTFTLPAPTALYFDSLTNNSQVHWALDGPTGRLVNNWNFSSGDNNLGVQPAGSYVLTVSANSNSDTTSGYQFRVLDLGAAALPTYFGFTGATSNPPPPQVRLQAGWPAAGGLAPGRAFAVCAAAISDWPVTNLAIAATGAFSTNLTVAGGGPYALTFPLPGSATPGSTVVFTATATDALGRSSAPATLTLNVASPTGQASPVVYYSRGGSPDGQLWVAALDGSFDVPLMAGEQPRISPDGRQLAFHRDNATYGRGRVYVVDVQTGSVRMLLDNPDYIVGYSWTPDSARLVFDYSCDVEQVNLDGGNRHQLFSGNCYDDAPAVNPLDGRVAFHNTVSGGGIGVVNADGSGKQFVANTAPGDVWPAWSPDGQWISFQDGTNCFKIRPDASGLTQLTSVPAVGDGFNGPGSWTPDGNHLVVAGTFNGVNGLYSVATDGSRTITLISTAAGAAIDFVGSVIAVPATSVPFVGTPWGETVAISGAVAPANGAAAWKFSAQAGQLLTFQPGASSGFTAQGQPRWLLQDPLGNVLFESWFTTAVSPLTAPFAGDYTLVVYGWINETTASGSFGLQIQSSGNLLSPSIATLPGTPLVLGTVVSNSVTAVQSVNYTFTLATPTRLIFDSLTANDQVRWSLSTRDADFVSNRSFLSSDANDVGDATVAVPAGQYQLTVSSAAAGTNTFQFRLLNFTSATPFTPGTVVSNTLSPANSTALYQFSGTAGDRYYFDGQAASGFTYTPYSRLYGPLGNLIQSLYVTYDLDTFSLPQTGTYTLTVEGRVYDNNASGTYAFNLLPEAYPTNALVIGNTITGTVPVLGQRQTYTFTLPSAATLYFDALTNADFIWRLDAPWGPVIDWRSFGNSDSVEAYNANPALPLAAGSYTLTVAGNSFQVTGTYQFRLLNFTNTIPFTPGTPVTNVLSPASSTVFYQFSGTAGDRYYFDGRTGSGFTYYPYSRLYGPLGNVVQAMNVNSDVDTFSLPQTGAYTLTVEGRVFDNNASGTYAFNLVPNPVVPPQPLFSTNVTPDLVVTSVTVTPGTLQSGASATVHWTDANAGNGPTSGSFADRVTMRNAASLVLVDAFLPYNEGEAGNGPIAAGDSRSRQLAVTLPDGTNSVGTLQVTVATDAQNRITESNEANNATTTTVLATLAPYPDLLVTQLSTTPVTGWLPGSVVTLHWRVTNSGLGIAATNWVDSVVVRNTNTAQTILSVTTNYTLADAGNGPIAAGDFRDRSLSFTVPTDSSAYGAFALTVTVDSANQVFEYNPGGTAELNNATTLKVISAPDLVPSGLAVLPPGSLHSGDTITISWNDGNTGTVETGSGFSDRVTVVNLNTTETLLNTTVFYNPSTVGNGPIPPNGSRVLSTTFGLPDGPRAVGTLQITIGADTYNQLPEANPSETGEANNSTALNITTTIAAYPDLQVVNLTIQPASLASGTNVTIRWQDTNSGSALAAANWYDHVVVVNTNTGVTLLDTSVLYDTNVLGRLTNGTARDRAYSFTLPNGTNAVGNLQFAVTADLFNSVFEYNAGGTAENNNTALVVVASAIAPYPDLQVINLSVDPATLASGTNGTIHWQDANTGNAPARASWYDHVTVANTNSGVTLLDTAVLYDTNLLGVLTNGAARDRSCNFTLPYTTNGAGNLRFTVAADTYNSLFEYNAGGTGEINNTLAVDRVSALTPLPDLVISALTAPASALTDHAISVQFRLANQGLLGMTGNSQQRVFISDTPTPASGTLAAVTAFDGSLDINQSVDQTVSVLTPSVPGTYWLSAQADASDNVLELAEDNNTYVRATPITILPAYSATVVADVHQALANTPIPMHGAASLGGTGGPASFVPITIHVQVRGTDRTYPVLTASDGTFTNVFYPLPNEAGVYQLAAAFPNVANPPSQDTFTLIGMSVTPVPVVSLIEGDGVTNTTRVSNLSDVPLTGLTVTVLTNAPNLAVTAELDTNALAGLASANLKFAITALNPSIVQSAARIRLASAEAAIADLTVFVRVQPLLPQLTATPVSLNAAMLRGAQTPIAFTLANKGGVATGPLDVVPPNVPWLSLISLSQLPALAPGSNTVITLLLKPASDLPFGDYNGTVLVRSTNAALQMPFSFRPISDAQGSMLVAAEDEYTYFASGSPRVTNARVVLSDVLSGSPVVTNYTGADGTVLLTNLTEDYYLVDVSATNHNAFLQSALVVAGQTTNITAFLSRQTVTYTFTVVPTTVQDAYTFQVDSTFETQVPIPVVTIEPASLDLSPYPGTEFQVNLTISNHGLIDAQDVKLNIPSTDRLQLTPLVTDLGKLKANTSLTVPMKVKRLSAPPAGAAAKAGPGKQDYTSGTCSITGQMLWDYLCGPNVVDKSTAVYVGDSTGCDMVALYRQVYNLVPDAPGPGSASGGSGWTSDQFFDYLESLQPVDSFEAPAGYHFECKAAPSAPMSASRLSRQEKDVTKLGNNSVCAKVQLRLDQSYVITRDAFKATLEIDNQDPTPLQNVRVTLQITDMASALVTTNFASSAPVLAGLSAVDGSGTLPASTAGSADWTLIPTLDAAPTNGVARYLVGGTLSYTENGSDVSVPLAPAPIQVFPQPVLLVRYFHDRDVFADDPFTPQIEPSLPYSLAVQVNNVGYGAARSLSIASGKPQIVDNLKGLLIDFTLLGTQLENQPVTPALNVQFGAVDPGTNKIARWLFTSSIQGSFTNFSTSFSQVDQFGKARLSLVRSVEIHELSHIVDAGGPFADGRPDFLVNDVKDPDLLPDTLYLSDGSTNSVGAVTNVTVTGTLGGGNLAVTVTAAPQAGWTYFRFQDPGQGLYQLTRALRGDNSEVAFGTNVWTTDRFLRGGDLVPIRTNLVHLFDYNSAGQYTLQYVPTSAAPDTTPPSSAVAALPAASPPNFAVQWSGTDNPSGSGIVQFDIYVSVNGGPFTLWLTNTTLRAAIYTGVANSTYSFYSRATDAAGNQEAAPSSADAQTTITLAGNTAPSMVPIPTQSVTGGALFTLTPQATDADVPAQVLSWSLLPGGPAGALIAPTSGRLTWQTGPADTGTTNTFMLVVTDNGTPSLSATQSFKVVVTRTNHAPAIVVPPPQVNVDEQTLLSLLLSANDPDLSDTLTWQLASAPPSGLALNPATGLLTWTPTESQGPDSYVVKVTVRDNGTPSLSDTTTFIIVVNEVNRAPALTPIADRSASVLDPLVLTNTASDPDIPANALTFSLGSGAPVGASINPTNGVFSWTPSRDQAGTTNVITVVVTDDGVPPLQDSKFFSVVVGDYVEATIGSTVVQGGQAGTVPITIDVSTPVTNVSFTLDVSPPGLSGFTLPAPTPPLAQATLQQLSPGRFQIQFKTLAGQALLGPQIVSSLQFVASAAAPSAFGSLHVSNLAATTTNATSLSRTLTQDGRVTLLNVQPLLEVAGNGVQLQVNIYAEAGPTYTLWSTPSLTPPIGWSPVWTGQVANQLQTIPVPINQSATFYRVSSP